MWFLWTAMFWLVGIPSLTAIVICAAEALERYQTNRFWKNLSKSVEEARSDFA